MKHRNWLTAAIAAVLAASSCLAFAASGQVALRGNRVLGSQLPDIQCSRTQCNMVQPAAARQRWGVRSLATPLEVTPEIASPTPVEVAPPAGQRFLWQGAAYPACQSVASASPGSPYTYINATSIPVPLGSTHISLHADFEGYLTGGPAGAGAIVGELEVKPSSGSTWTVVQAGYAYTQYGSDNPQNLFGMASYQGLVNLADLNGGSVPSEIDVRVITFPLFTAGFTNVGAASVCWGNLQLSF
ncbi:MAG TPA: hypothetical protein VFL63_06585 [Rhodanobacteraceae bacterium]|nr:hypothetical protein [Rhodanobacteraceae bacterium]